jgi:tetratricopeptide (TPR) repeat protein
MTAGCGNDRTAGHAPQDPTLARSERLARLSFEQERPDQAATLYRQALDRSYERDDLQAIADLGYNLAVVDLRRGQFASALATAQATRGEIVRRGGAPAPELLLAEAVALYRQGDGSGAAELASTVAGGPDTAAETRARAIFVQGLVAADSRDAAALATAVAALDPASGEEIAADRRELEGRLASLRGDWTGAIASLLSVAASRRDALDYRGMARALALAGGAAESAGRYTEAADLYLRAGRSAQLQDDRPHARAWLMTARNLGERIGEPAIAAEARVRLDALVTASGRSS